MQLKKTWLKAIASNLNIFKKRLPSTLPKSLEKKPYMKC